MKANARRWRFVDPFFLAGMAAVLLAGAAFRAHRPDEPRPPVPVLAPGALAELEARGGGRTVGDAGAPVRVVEFTDYQCPACAAAYDSTAEPLLRLVRAGAVRYTVYELPLPRHANAVPAAVAAGCAADEGGASYGTVRAHLYATRPAWADAPQPEPLLTRIVGAAGADTAAVAACLARDGARRAAALRARWEAASAAGVTFTPAFVVNDRLVPWPRLAEEIGSALAGAAGRPAGPATVPDSSSRG